MILNITTSVAATTPTFSVVRNDTGGPVASGSMSFVAGTAYQYTATFTEPSIGLTYTVTYDCTINGSHVTWQEVVMGATTSASQTVSMPPLTGDPLIDTLNSLLATRLQVLRDGPSPSYRVHSHEVSWTEYLKYLDGCIAQVRRELAQSYPLEQIGIGI